jgi:Fe-S cluster biogenesis protein NfuA
MFIQTEITPNPNSLKFIPEQFSSGTNEIIEIKNKEDSKLKSQLAEDIFSINGISSLMFGKNFITINKTQKSNWEKIEVEVIAIITDFLLSGQDILKQSSEELGQNILKQSSKEISDNEDSEIIQQIKELIEIKIRPAVAMDGGDIVFDSFEEGIVYLRLKGSCSGCPSSSITLKNGIENMLKHYIPEVESVEQIED